MLWNAKIISNTILIYAWLWRRAKKMENKRMRTCFHTDHLILLVNAPVIHLFKLYKLHAVTWRFDEHQRITQVHCKSATISIRTRSHIHTSVCVFHFNYSYNFSFIFLSFFLLYETQSPINRINCATVSYWLKGSLSHIHCQVSVTILHAYKYTYIWKATYHNFQIHRFDSRMGVDSGIVASSFWLPKKSYSNRMVCAFYPIPKWNVPMLWAMKYSTQSNISTKMWQTMRLELNHPNILTVH